jgi:hypothetical protein
MGAARNDLADVNVVQALVTRQTRPPREKTSNYTEEIATSMTENRTIDKDGTTTVTLTETG